MHKHWHVEVPIVFIDKFCWGLRPTDPDQETLARAPSAFPFECRALLASRAKQ